MTTMAGKGGRRGPSWRLVRWGGAALLLLLPWLAMQVTDEVRWDAADFAAWGLMLLTAVGAYELAARVTRDAGLRAIAGAVVVVAFLLVWAELAVGVLD